MEREILKLIRVDKDLLNLTEALLIDPEVPVKVLEELVGLSEEDAAYYRTTYMQEFFGKPRMFQLKAIQRIPDKIARQMKEEVFFNGWEAIAGRYLRGKYIDSMAIGNRIASQLLAKMSYMGNASTISKSEMSLLKDLIKQANMTRPQNDVNISPEEWEIMLADINTAIEKEDTKTKRIQKEKEDEPPLSDAEILKKMKEET